MPATPNSTEAKTIVPRDIRFDVNVDRMADWVGGDAVKTAYFNALSMMFPTGERFFIGAVSAYAHRVTDPESARDVKGFISQEAMHTREHVRYNEALRPIVDLDAVEARQVAQVEFTKAKAPPIVHLAITCALEHFTAIMAHEVLKRDVYFADAEPSFARLWRWHAIEECEHKHVAFDVLRAATRGNDYKLRALTMLKISQTFTFDTLWNCNQIFLRAGTNRSPLTWAKLAWFLLGYPGFMRRLVPAYVQYYRRDFHPSHIDDTRERNRALRHLAHASAG